MTDDLSSGPALGPAPFGARRSLPSTAERVAAGRALRARLPRAAQAELRVAPERDPLAILKHQNSTRLQDLVPLRAERMSQSAFAFYRGTAAIMAADLAAAPHTGIVVASCGDAHVSNFGFYASPQRTLLFDLNDFDEAGWAPWEWDLKRLVASIVIAGRASARDDLATGRAVLSAVRAYARALRRAVRASPTARYFSHLDAEAGLGAGSGAARMDEGSRKVLRAAIAHARKRTGERAAKKLTRTDGAGRRRFVMSPPTMAPLTPAADARARDYLREYLTTAEGDVQQLMRHYTLADTARRVVGVGSVGTRCALVLLQDGDGNPLIMQSKEACKSVLEEFGGIDQPIELQAHVARYGQGARVVALQRNLQAVSDPLLGHLRADDADLYVRQFHDMKGGIDAEVLDDEPFAVYAQACAVILARAHSQSPSAAVASGYVGRGGELGEALLEWGRAYADLSAADYRAFCAASGTGETISPSAAT